MVVILLGMKSFIWERYHILGTWGLLIAFYIYICFVPCGQELGVNTECWQPSLSREEGHITFWIQAGLRYFQRMDGSSSKETGLSHGWMRLSSREGNLSTMWGCVWWLPIPDPPSATPCHDLRYIVLWERAVVTVSSVVGNLPKEFLLDAKGAPHESQISTGVYAFNNG